MRSKIIIVCVVLLFLLGGVYLAMGDKVIELTQKPMTAETNQGEVVNPDPQEKEAEVNLYYANRKYIETGDENLEKFVPVKRKIKYGKVSLAEASVRELQNEPGVDGLTTGIPKDVKLIGVESKEDTAYVNFSRQGLNGSSLQEMMTINQIVNTLTGIEGISSVQFLVDGKKVDSLMEHADVRGPFYKRVEIKLDELQLGDMKLYTKKDDFISKFGQPLAASLEYDGNMEYLEYEGFRVGISGGEAVEISTTSEKYATPSGIKVGDSFKQVMDVYGEPSTKHIDTLNYKVGPEYELLHITIEDGKVTEIRINLAC